MLAGVEARDAGRAEHLPASPGPLEHPTRDAGFGIYLHWPFCASKCPYCDFNSHVRHAGIDEPRFLAAFRAEIAHAAAMAPGRTVSSIFLGGGTPSLMRPETVAGLLDAVAASWAVAPNVEVTLEANPTSVEAGRFRGYRTAGVNRVSLGVQALDDADLKALGRLHTVAEALAAVETAAARFERFSFDLIYARPRQTPQGWRAELSQAIKRAAEHLSLYQLTIEPGTPFYGLAQAGRLVPPDDEQARVLYDVTQEVCDRAGLPAYEISNHARPGAPSRHNLLYWRYGEYAGIGPGAHGRLVMPCTVDRDAFPRPTGEGDRAQRGGVGGTEPHTGNGVPPSVRFAATSSEGGGEAHRKPEPSPESAMTGAERIATVTERSPEAWLARVERDGHGITELESISPETQADEFLMMGLRLTEGIDPARYAALAGRPLDAGRLDALVSDGLMVRRKGGRIAATARGAPVLNAVVAELAR